MSIVNSLHNALEEREFILYYQPIVDLGYGKMVGAEALIRWVKDDKLIPPSDFIPIAESSGMINNIGNWVLEQSCRQVGAWQRMGIPFPISKLKIDRSFVDGIPTGGIIATILYLRRADYRHPVSAF